MSSNSDERAALTVVDEYLSFRRDVVPTIAKWKVNKTHTPPSFGFKLGVVLLDICSRSPRTYN